MQQAMHRGSRLGKRGASIATYSPRRPRRPWLLRVSDEGYACEELVAELGAAVLALTPEMRDDHAAYIGH